MASLLSTTQSPQSTTTTTTSAFLEQWRGFAVAVQRQLLELPDQVAATATTTTTTTLPPQPHQGGQDKKKASPSFEPPACPPDFDKSSGTWATQPCQEPSCMDHAGRYAMLCDRHAEIRYQLRVQPSALPGVKCMGLFALGRFANGDCLGLYDGELHIDNDETVKRKRKEHGLDCDAYSLALPTVVSPNGHTLPPVPLYVDAQSTQSCVMRWANDGNGCSPPVANNARFRTMMHPSGLCFILFVEATCNIKPGDEIRIFYGDHYWSHQHAQAAHAQQQQ